MNNEEYKSFFIDVHRNTMETAGCWVFGRAKQCLGYKGLALVLEVKGLLWS